MILSAVLGAVIALCNPADPGENTTCAVRPDTGTTECRKVEYRTLERFSECLRFQQWAVICQQLLSDPNAEVEWPK